MAGNLLMQNGLIYNQTTGRLVGYKNPVTNADEVIDNFQFDDVTWVAGEVSSVVTSVIKADGDLSTATDQVPNYWRVAINAANDDDAANILRNQTSDCIVIVPQGTRVLPVQNGPVTNVYAICVSTASAEPANWTGGAYMMAGAGTSVATVKSNMVKVDFSVGLDIQNLMLAASQVYSTNYCDLIVLGGS